MCLEQLDDSLFLIILVGRGGNTSIVAVLEFAKQMELKLDATISINNNNILLVCSVRSVLIN